MGQTITIKDVDKVTRVIVYSDIMYLIADRNYTELYVMGYNSSLRVRGNISELTRKLPDNFIVIKRNFVANRDFIKNVEERIITMVDKYQVQIPNPKYTSIKRQIDN